MFIMFEVLFDYDRRVEQVVVSTPNAAFSLLWILEESSKVIAYKMIDRTPEEFGWAPSSHWSKLRTSFTQEDYND